MMGNTLRPKSGEGDASWQQAPIILAKRGDSFAAALPPFIPVNNPIALHYQFAIASTNFNATRIDERKPRLASLPGFLCANTGRRFGAHGSHLITITLDTYGHLFPTGEDAKELGKAERALMECDTNATWQLKTKLNQL